MLPLNRITTLFVVLMALALAGCQSGPPTALGDDCSVCDLTDPMPKGAADAVVGGGGVDQVQAPNLATKDFIANPKTNTGSGGLYSADEHRRRSQSGTGGNQYQGLLNYLPGVASKGGGAISPAEAKISEALEGVERRMAKAEERQDDRWYAALATQQRDLLRQLATASAGNRGDTHNNFFLHGSKAQILGLSKATADQDRSSSSDEAEAKSFAAGSDAAKESVKEVMAAENGANVPEVPPLPARKAAASLPPVKADPSLFPPAPPLPVEPAAPSGEGSSPSGSEGK